MSEIVESLLPESLLPDRNPESHKGIYGTALLVAGSCGMLGAAVLAGRAALRGGSGVVRVMVPSGIQNTVASMQPEYMVYGVSEDEAGRISQDAQHDILRAALKASALAVGPGLGRSDQLNTLIATLWTEVDIPLIMDADGLNALSEVEKTEDIFSIPTAGFRIITPHPREFDRLWGEKAESSLQREQRAVRLAEILGIIVVLKGHKTLVTDGARVWYNTTGNAGMATGGAGDVLTGLILSFLSQGLAPWDASRLGVYLHGLSGDLAMKRLGGVSLIAGDLIDSFPQAVGTWKKKG